MISLTKEAGKDLKVLETDYEIHCRSCIKFHKKWNLSSQTKASVSQGVCL